MNRQRKVGIVVHQPLQEYYLSEIRQKYSNKNRRVKSKKKDDLLNNGVQMKRSSQEKIRVRKTGVVNNPLLTMNRAE